jgi:lysophospholipase L1-like esterase
VSLFTVVVLAIVQVAFWAAVEDRVSRNLDVERVYRVLFEGRADDFAGEQIYYEPHQYLPYVLNPDRIVNGQRQFNAIFRIRRSEPIRTRSEVTWRALALGGSTTYGEPLADEADTWVAQLERLIRTEYGPSFDVINGGVGGYTLYENVIHYMTLLTHLDPDVVILFEGINDVHPRIFGEIAYDYSNYRTPWRNNEAFPPVDYRLAWLTPYRYIYLRHAIEPTALEGIGALVNKPYPDPSLWQEALQRNTVDNYRTMLENLVLLLRAQGRQVVIIPQYYLPRYDTDWIFKIGVDENNLVNHEIADKYNLPFVDSVIAPGTFEPGDTVDSTHFNADGSAKMANLMFAFMKQHGLLRTTDSS